MNNNIEEALSKKKWAVLGATQSKQKFGYKVFNRLKKHDYKVFPVNPGLEQIDGLTCYKGISDIPEPIEVVSMIVNPKIGITILEDAKAKGAEIIWCQPGAESQELVNKAKDIGLKVIYNECVLVELR